MTHPSVPWNAAWTGEQDFELRPCAYAQGRLALWQSSQPGVGKPMFAEPHAVRQRQSIAEMRCTVCGDRTPKDDRWWFGHGNYHADMGMWMTTESPVHAQCAMHSMSVCPHLRLRGLTPMRFPAGAMVMASTIKVESLREVWGLDTDEPAVGHLKLAWHIPPPPTGSAWIIPPIGTTGIASMKGKNDG